MKLFLLTVTSLFLTGCGVIPQPSFATPAEFDTAMLGYGIVQDKEPKAIIYKLGKWRGREPINSFLLEEISTLFVEVDGERIRLKRNIEINKKAMEK